MSKYLGAVRCCRANMTRAANLLERAKDEPANFDYWYAQACRADQLANEWRAEAQRLKDAGADTSETT
jgi:hypothetical protein